MPFPPKKKPAFGKPEEEKPAPFGKPAPEEAPADEPAPEGEEAPAPAKPGTPAPAKGKGGNSAPVTPGQGEPDVKPHPEAGAKQEPEEDKQALPSEADEGMAKEQPKGLPSLAVMTKAEAESAAKDPMNNPHIQRLASLVQGLAQIVQSHEARIGAMPLAGQTSQMGQQKPMPGALGAKPGMPGAKPGMPGAKPGMPGAKPGMTGMQRPGQPGVAGQGMRPGVTAPTAGAAMTLEQIQSIMGIVEAANSGRVSRQGASMLIARGFGLDEKTALAMVSADAAAPGAVPGLMEPPVDENSPDGLEALAPEGGAEVPPGEEPPVEGDPAEGQPGEEPEIEEDDEADFWEEDRLDASDNPFEETLVKLEASRARLVKRLDALHVTRAIYFEDLFSGLDD